MYALIKKKLKRKAIKIQLNMDSNILMLFHLTCHFKLDQILGAFLSGSNHGTIDIFLPRR